MPDIPAREFRARLLRWYERAKRDLPWRSTSDPYCIWVSEIMLQQTRVAAALPYYERFLARFPDIAALARADEAEVLTAWSGLGYYSRARNLHKAAKLVAGGGFPRDYDGIREMPGVGEYTAAAIASIAFGLPYPVLDGNVLRVLARVGNDSGDIRAASTRQRLRATAAALLDLRAPGDFNQALMELGATVCLPRHPKCEECPVAALCEAHTLERQSDLPVKAARPATVRVTRELLLIERRGRILMWQRQGFWELPEPEHVPYAAPGAPAGTFRHTIMNRSYSVRIFRAGIAGEACLAPTERHRGRGAGHALPDFEWVSKAELSRVPLSTLTRKALAAASRNE